MSEKNKIQRLSRWDQYKIDCQTNQTMQEINFKNFTIQQKVKNLPPPNENSVNEGQPKVKQFKLSQEKNEKI